jgi:AraC-like DNA-binding protein
MAMYWFLQIRLLTSLKAVRKDKIWIHWLYIYNGLQPLLFIFPILAIVSGPEAIPWAISVIPTAGGLLSAATLFFYPRILYNLEKPMVRLGLAGKRKLSSGFRNEFPERLARCMREQKPFLRPDCSLEQLAEETNVPAYKLSAFINQVEKKNFSDYINAWRINYCLEMLQEKKLDQVNFQDVATECGFGNRAAFTTAFKKVVGLSPSIYLQSEQ